MLKKLKANKLYLEGIFYIIFISTLILLSYMIGLSDVKKVLGF